MTLVINNLTSSARTYLSGTISVPANSSLSITLTTQQFQLATDGGLRSDIFANNATITDGTNSFGVEDAINYLYQILRSLGPTSDGSGNPITSTVINSKQRLDIDLASEGVDGSTVPTLSVQIAGKDVNGNLQTLSTDVTGAVYTTERLPLSGSSPAAVSVGVASGVVIAANAARRGLVLINTSTGIISFNINGGTAVLRSGITLYPGGIFEMDPFTFTTSAINGIASVAASNLAIQELV